jgi:hypothetical protein
VLAGLPDGFLAALQAGFARDGYVQIPASSGLLPWSADIASMARAVRTLKGAGWHPQFLTLFDEPWVVAAQVGKLIAAASGGNLAIGDWSVFYVDPAEKLPHTHDDMAKKPADQVPAGWPPHRDRGERGVST